MKRALPLLTATTLLLAGCANPADDVPKAEVEAAGTQTAPATTSGVEYVLTDNTTVGFVGSKVTGSHEGGFKNVSGSLTVVGGTPEGSRVEVVMDTTSLWADNDRLAGHLKSPDFFDIEKFPTARFTSTKIAKSGESYAVTGDLELHGIRKSITFPAEISVSDGKVTAAAEFAINRFEYDMKYPGRADDLIREEVVIKLDVEAVPKA